MSQILSAVRRTARSRSTAEYEDLDERVTESLPSTSSIPRQLEDHYDSHVAAADEIEMTSVSVVPDERTRHQTRIPCMDHCSLTCVSRQVNSQTERDDLSQRVDRDRDTLPPSSSNQDTFTVTQAVNAFGFGRFQVKLSLFTGLCWMSDSMEMTILSILSPALHCEWHITRYQQALTTTIVFLGMMLSSTFWGNLSDRYGRKQALTLCAVLLFFYGLLSSLAPNFIWILFLRGLVGFAIGCVPQSVTLYAEFLPTKQRAKCVVLLDCFWALGASLEVLLALLIMPTLGWQWLLALSTIPLLAFAIITPWLPESARFHVASGQSEEALATLQKIAKENGKPMLLGRLVVDDVSACIAPRGRVTHLLRPELRKTSLLLWVIWVSCAFCYYGVVLMTTELFESSCSDKSRTVPELNCAADCKELSTKDYVDLLWTTLAEFPGILATVFVIERFGRKNTMAVQFIIFTICICFLFVCTDNRVFLTIMLFLARGIIAGVFQAAYVYTPEVYPTQLRSVGVGTCSAMARLGAMVTPYVAQVLMQSSLTLATIVYGLAALVAAVACFFLPIETKGREMVETVPQK